MNIDSSPPLTVLVARHGRSEANEARTVAGQLDVPLSHEGHRQAEALAELVADRNLSAICSSSLRRTIDTARPTATAHGLKIQAIDAFRELHFGTLEGRSRDIDDEVRLAYEAWRAAPDRATPPGGETISQLEHRVRPALAQLIAGHHADCVDHGETILIVGHQVVNRIIIGTLMESVMADYIHLKLRSRHVYEISLGAQRHIRTLTIRANSDESASRAVVAREGLHV
jgi:broad specificity phosphatase PhoE